MNRLKISILFLLIISSCRNGEKEIPASDTKEYTDYYTWEVFKRDTLNMSDSNGKKQGIWILRQNYLPKDTVFYKDGKIDSLPSGWILKNNSEKCRNLKKSQ